MMILKSKWSKRKLFIFFLHVVFLALLLNASITFRGENVVQIMTNENKDLTEFANTTTIDLFPATPSNLSISRTDAMVSIWNKSLITSMTRSYSIWNGSSDPYNWCHGPENETNSGLLFVKVNKCASSTGMGVTLRIADTLGRRRHQQQQQHYHHHQQQQQQRLLPFLLQNESKCFTRYNHGWASTQDRKYQHRPRQRSILWSMIRHPASRVLSDYFFYEASRKNRHVTEMRILRHVQNPRFQSHYVNYLRLMESNATVNNYNNKNNNNNRLEEISHILQNYDFLAISERMDESLVVLSMLWRLPLADLIVLPSKEAGGYDDGRSRKGCVKLKKKWTTPKIDRYLQTDFLNQNYDFLLYQVVNASLDRTIDDLGRDTVHRNVQLFHSLMKKNEQECRREAIFPCPIVIPNQTKLAEIDCYFSDAGCGHRCTDRALRDESEHQWAILKATALGTKTSST
jgi:hypothetical protein